MACQMMMRFASPALRVCSKQAVRTLSQSAPRQMGVALPFSTNPFRIVVPTAVQSPARTFHNSQVALWNDGYSDGPVRRDGDWDCPSCGAMVFASKSTCYKCGTARDGTQSSGHGGDGGGRGRNLARRDGDWDCPDCGAHVFASKSECFRCGAPNPNPNPNQHSPPASVPVDPGGLQNGTGALAGTVASWNNSRGFGFITPEDGGDDVFVHFTKIQDGNALLTDSPIKFDIIFDDSRGKDHADNVSGGVQVYRGGGLGSSQRGGGKVGARDSGFARRDGDWDCSSCDAMNFASRSECFKCGTPKAGGALSDDAAW